MAFNAFSASAMSFKNTVILSSYCNQFKNGESKPLLSIIVRIFDIKIKARNNSKYTSRNCTGTLLVAFKTDLFSFFSVIFLYLN
jgi:hypothetical protein